MANFVVCENARLEHFIKVPAANGQPATDKREPKLSGLTVEEAQKECAKPNSGMEYSRSSCVVVIAGFGSSVVRYAKPDQLGFFKAVIRFKDGMLEGYDVKKIAVAPYDVNGQSAKVASIVVQDGEDLLDAITAAGHKPDAEWLANRSKINTAAIGNAVASM